MQTQSTQQTATRLLRGQERASTLACAPALIEPQRAPDAILRLPELIKMLGISRSSVYLRLKKGTKYFEAGFPLPVRLGAKSVGWRLSEVQAYIEQLSSRCD